MVFIKIKSLKKKNVLKLIFIFSKKHTPLVSLSALYKTQKQSPSMQACEVF